MVAEAQALVQSVVRCIEEGVNSIAIEVELLSWIPGCFTWGELPIQYAPG